jgi:hypothetical protein
VPQCNTLIETQALLTLPIVWAFLTRVSTTPSADFCHAVKTPHDARPALSAQSTSNSVTVTSHEAPTTGTITKGFAGNTSGCATARYNVTVTNTSATGTDETLSLSALDDSPFGSITSVHDSALGTTCGVATDSPGLGSLSGSTGAGALPATIPVNGGTYTCQFDGNFCSGLDGQGCFSHTNTVSATLTGDENEVVSLTPGTLNLKECLLGTVQ